MGRFFLFTTVLNFTTKFNNPRTLVLSIYKNSSIKNIRLIKKIDKIIDAFRYLGFTSSAIGKW